MGYAQLDNSFWINPKISRLSDKGFRLYVRAISFSSANLTDGQITKDSLRILSGTAKLADELVAGGVWEADSDGWRIHDYHRHNTAKARVDSARNAANARWGNAPALPSEDAPAYATALRPHDAKQNRTEQNRTEQKSLSSAAPPSEREMVETLLSKIPAPQKHDPLTRDECEQFAKDFPGMFSEVAMAIVKVRQEGKMPFPTNLRRHMPGWQQRNSNDNRNRSTGSLPNAERIARIAQQKAAGLYVEG